MPRINMVFPSLARRACDDLSSPRNRRDWDTGSVWILLPSGAQTLPEAVADAADRFDQVGVAELAPQRLDVDVDGPFQHDRSLSDGAVHQLMAGEGPSGLANQAFQHAELGRRER